MKIRVNKNPDQQDKIPKPTFQIQDFQNAFGAGKWKLASRLGMSSRVADNSFYLIACRLRMVEIDIVWEFVLEPKNLFGFARGSLRCLPSPSFLGVAFGKRFGLFQRAVEIGVLFVHLLGFGQ